MNLLFDTHAFIWWDSEPAKLSARVLTLCHDTANVLFLSVASVWEMQIKQQLGKLFGKSQWGSPSGLHCLGEGQACMDGIMNDCDSIESAELEENFSLMHERKLSRIVIRR